MKVALEKFWAGKLPQTELIDVAHATQATDWQLQADAGITRVGIDGTLYDQVRIDKANICSCPMLCKAMHLTGSDEE